MRKQQNLLKAIGISTILVIIFGACNLSGRIPRAAATPDQTAWSKTDSPLFPTSWPPTADTVWVSYTFAYGSNPASLADGAYVSSPLSKTEWQGGKSTTTVLSSDMKQAAVQGISPLDEQGSTILANEKQVSAYCLKLTESPDPSGPETKEMLAYYQTWFKYNAAFLGLIREDHANFINWITANQ